MMRVFVEGIGIAGPGLSDWTGAAPVLAGRVPWRPAPYTPPPVAKLPPAERRRAGTAIRLAFAAGAEALDHAGRDPATMAMVFASSNGDSETVHDILCTLATERREVSPTRFHNSVHNAPAGYWAVAMGSRETSTSLCAFDDSFSAGLLEAAVQATVDRRPVTLNAYDVPYPEPLHGVRPIVSVFATALVLTPEPTERTLARFDLLPGQVDGNAAGMDDPALERLRLGNPAARGLPLLAVIARQEAATVRLPAACGTGLTIAVVPR